MIKQETIIDFGNGKWGEDRVFAGDGLYFVIDGATPISGFPFGGYHTGAEWMADALRQYLALPGSGDGDIPFLCKQFTTQTYEAVRKAFDDVQDMPSLTIAAIRRNEESTIGYVLGDCSIYVLTKTGEITRLTDQRTAAFYEKTLQAKADARKMGYDVEAAVQCQRRRNKAAMNRPGGFWTVSYTGDYEDEFFSFRIPTTETKAILLCTDGFDRIFSRGLFSPGCLLQEEVSLAEAISRLRAAEKESPGDVKQHDDAAAILLITK